MGAGRSRRIAPGVHGPVDIFPFADVYPVHREDRVRRLRRRIKDDDGDGHRVVHAARRVLKRDRNDGRRIPIHCEDHLFILMGRRLRLPVDHRGQPALDAVHPVRLHGDGQCLLEGGSCGGLHRLRHTVQQGVGVFTDIRAVHGPSVQVGRAVDLRVVVLPGEVHIDGRDRPGLGRPERRLSADVRRDRDLHRIRARLQVRPEVERVDLSLVYRYTRGDRDAGDGDGSRPVSGRVPVRVRRGHPVLQHRSVAIDESRGSRRHPGDGHPAGGRARSASSALDQQRLQEILSVLIVEVQIVIVVILPVVDRHAGLPGLDGDILRRAARVDDPDAGIGFDDVFHRIAGRFDCFLELRHHARQRGDRGSQLG